MLTVFLALFIANGSTGASDFLKARSNNEIVYSYKYATHNNGGITINVKNYGANGDGVTDDSRAIQNAFNATKSGDAIVIFPKGTYKISTSLKIQNNGSLTIKGDGSVITPVGTGGYSIVNITQNTTATSNIEDLTINGQYTTQSQWGLTNWNKRILNNGLDITGGNANITNCKLENIWGNGIRFLQSGSIIMNGVVINNVGGHWYQNNTYDAFGDAIYIGDRSNITNVTINNVQAVGKTDDRTNAKNNLSRIGIAVENLKKGYSDTKTMITVTNSSFTNYERSIHVEGNLGSVIFNISNTNLKGRVLFLGFNNKVKPIINIDKSSMAFYKGNYNGTYGLAKSAIVKATNCTINNTGDGQAMGASQTEADFLNCTFDNMTGTFATNSNVKLENSNIKIASSKKGNLFWNTDSYFKGCSFTTKDGGAYTIPNVASKAPIFDNCTFTNVRPLLPKQNLLNSKIIN